MMNKTKLMAWAALALVTSMSAARAADEDKKAAAAKPRPALSVKLVAAEAQDWPQALSASGSVAPWQEAVVGAEISGLRLARVLVNVGDRVKRGQLLAELSSDTVQAELAQSRAAAAEAEAHLEAARLDAERARALQAGGSGALSAQQLQQYLTGEQTAKARFEAARARVRSDELRLAQTRISAPDEGVISARTATLGAVVQGQELFRLIRGHRLEWRAEVPAAELARLKPGLGALVEVPGAQPVRGRLRMVAPTVDAATRNGLVYIDLPADAMTAGLRAGSFVRGQIQLGQARVMTLPQAAVQPRDGFSYVFKVGNGGKVQQIKVGTGRRVGERIELLGGLDAGAQVVASGVGFLADGDLVQVVQGSVGSK
jgi:RND family efflux transporter MFP subunit